MTRRRTLLLIALPVVLVLVVTLGVRNRARLREGSTFVDNSLKARWSKDGRELFYVGQHPEGDKLCLYDVRTRRMHVYGYPKDVTVEYYDLSPDGNEIVAGDLKKVEIVDLSTGKHRQIYYCAERKHKPDWAQDIIESVDWIPQDLLLVTVRTPLARTTSVSVVYLIDPHTDSRTAVTTRWMYNFYAAHDGSGFVYEGNDGHQHLFDLRSRTDRKLETARLKQHRSFTFIYLSKKMLVYTFNTPDPVFEMLNLKTMKTKRIRMAPHDMHQDGDISPLLTSQWFSSSLGLTQRDSTDLYLEDIPKETIKQLRSAEACR